jgi:hypothetical protein
MLAHIMLNSYRHMTLKLPLLLVMLLFLVCRPSHHLQLTREVILFLHHKSSSGTGQLRSFPTPCMLGGLLFSFPDTSPVLLPLPPCY